jgi:hypothetical protein
MLPVRIEYDGKKKLDLSSPTFIEGLSGVGNVGMLAADHLIKKLNARKIADVYSPYFTYSPSHIPGIESKNGIACKPKDEIFCDETNNLLILIGYYQGSTPESYYELATKILDFCEYWKVKRIFTLGGYGTGRWVEKPNVYGVATDRKILEEAKKHGVLEMKGGMVTGISGILLGLGHERGIGSLCLLGETHGAYSDPSGAEAVVRALTSILGISVDTRELREERRILEQEMKRGAQLLRKIKHLEDKEREELRYIG